MSSNAPDTRRILGTLGSADGKGVVRIEDRFDTDIDDLWSAVTDPRRLALWLGVVEGELRLGGELRARFFSSGWEGTGRITACEPPHRWLVLTRAADAPDGSNDHTIEVTLTADGSQTILVWEGRGMPVDLLAAYGAGNQIHIEDLGAYIAGRERSDDADARWKALLPAYQELAANVTS